MVPHGGWREAKTEERSAPPTGRHPRVRAPKRRRPVFLSLLVTVCVLMLAMVALPLVHISAEEGKVITLGESLSPEQQNELLNYFGYTAGQDRDPITITTAETIKAMDGIFPASQITSAFSSTALTCRNLGDGLDVTTSNITLVTPGLYAMALVTAGIGDATLVVAAPASAQAQGMTALTGVFKTWDIAPCDSGDTNAKRQRLALEELTLTVQIGQALATPEGVQKATDVVLNTQQTIVTKHLSKKNDINQAIAAQEQAAGVAIPAQLRPQLVDLLTRLSKEKIDWSTFSAGWNIERPAPNRITMTGDGIAIRNARLTATAEAAAAMTATAAANMTATANAQATIDAQMTATAQAAMTQTAEARPTDTPRPSPTPSPTATPLPTATPEPIGLAGTIDGTDDGQIAIVVDGGSEEPVTYPVDAAASIVRDGKPAAFDAIKKGDHAVVTVDGSSKQVTDLILEPAPSNGPPIELFLVVGVGLIGGVVVAKRRLSVEPFVIKHVEA